VEQFAPSLTVACPAHGGPDHVRQVSHVYGEAATVTPARLLLSAERLAWAGTACGVLGAVILSIRAVLSGGGAASVPLLVAACVCFGYAVACYGLAHARRIGAFLVRPPVRRRGPGDDEQAVWYCERCNAVFTEKTR
jgi:peptidoglycan/LPS O-acetylase OafA/YrhL